MPGIGVVNNPRSRQNKKHPERMKKLGYILGQDGESKATWSFEELDDVMEEFYKRDIDILAINGGDGSNHVTLTSMINTWKDTKPLPKISFLRGGTLNTISDACGIKGTTTWLLYNLADKYGHGLPFQTTHRTLMKIGKHYGFIFGNGIVANYMHTYYTTGTPSPSQGVKVFLRGMLSAILGTELAKQWFDRVHAEIIVNGEVLEKRGWGSMFGGSIHEIGVGFSPFFRCEDEEDKFHMTFLDGGPLGLALDIPYVYFGRPIHPKLIEERLVTNCQIKADKPFKYIIDGDIHEASDGMLELSSGPRVEIIQR